MKCLLASVQPVLKALYVQTSMIASIIFVKMEANASTVLTHLVAIVMEQILRANFVKHRKHVHSAAKMTSADSNIEEYDYDSSSTRITVIIITWRSCFQSTYTLICGSTDDGPFPQGQHEESDDTSTARYADRRVLVSISHNYSRHSMHDSVLRKRFPYLRG